MFVCIKNNRRKIQAALLSFLNFSVFFLFTAPHAACSWEDPDLADNLPPVINNILVDGRSVSSPRVREEQKVVFTAIAWDPNGDGLVPEGFVWNAEEGELDSTTGSSVLWTAPSVEWETPLQEVLIDIQVRVADGRGGEDQKVITVKVEPPCDPSAPPPSIIDISARPESISLGETSTIRVNASDPGGAPLTYDWTVPFGTYEGEGAEIEWLANDTCCRDWYPVQVFVGNGCKTSWAKVEVEVIP